LFALNALFKVPIFFEGGSADALDHPYIAGTGVVGKAVPGVIVLVIGAIGNGSVVQFRGDEPNICSLEYRAAYLESHDSDAELRRECPFESWDR